MIERVEMPESADEREPIAATSESAVAHERAGDGQVEPAASTPSGPSSANLAEADERDETNEQASRREGAGSSERVVAQESADEDERADDRESAEHAERAAAHEESADTEERPKHQLGYPRIGSPSHHLWDAQQSGWPDHLPHEAWRDMVSQQRRDDQPKASSADHPAFAAGYVPNYAATAEKPSEDYIAGRQGKARR